MDAAAQTVQRIARVILPGRPHTIAVDYETRHSVPETRDGMYVYEERALPQLSYMTLLHDVDRSPLLTRGYHDMRDDPRPAVAPTPRNAAAGTTPAASSGSGAATAAAASAAAAESRPQLPKKILSLKDYATKKKDSTSPNSRPGTATPAEANGSAPDPTPPSSNPKSNPKPTDAPASSHPPGHGRSDSKMGSNGTMSEHERRPPGLPAKPAFTNHHRSDSRLSANGAISESERRHMGSVGKPAHDARKGEDKPHNDPHARDRSHLLPPKPDERRRSPSPDRKRRAVANDDEPSRAPKRIRSEALSSASRLERNGDSQPADKKAQRDKDTARSSGLSPRPPTIGTPLASASTPKSSTPKPTSASKQPAAGGLLNGHRRVPSSSQLLANKFPGRPTTPTGKPALPSKLSPLRYGPSSSDNHGGGGGSSSNNNNGNLALPSKLSPLSFSSSLANLDTAGSLPPRSPKKKAQLAEAVGKRDREARSQKAEEQSTKAGTKRARSPLRLPPLLSPTLPPELEEALLRYPVPVSSDDDSEDEPKPKRVLVTLKYSRRNSKQVQRLLATKPKHKTKDSARSTPVEGADDPPASRKRPRDEITGASDVGGKRPRAGDVPAESRPSSHAPITPPQQQAASRPSAPAMSRLASNNSLPDTPGATAGLTPSGSGQPGRHAPTSHGPSSQPNGAPTREERIASLRQREARLVRIGPELKTKRDRIFAKGSTPAPPRDAAERRAIATWMVLGVEASMAFLQTFRLQDQCAWLEARPHGTTHLAAKTAESLRSAFRSLHPFLAMIVGNARAAGDAHMQGLVAVLSAVTHDEHVRCMTQFLASLPDLQQSHPALIADLALLARRGEAAWNEVRERGPDVEAHLAAAAGRNTNSSRSAALFWRLHTADEIMDLLLDGLKRWTREHEIEWKNTVPYSFEHT